MLKHMESRLTACSLLVVRPSPWGAELRAWHKEGPGNVSLPEAEPPNRPTRAPTLAIFPADTDYRWSEGAAIGRAGGLDVP